MFLDGGELLVRERHVAGQADTHAFVGRQPEFGRRGADDIRRRLARLKRRKVELRLHLKKAAQIARARLFAGHELAPGEERRLAVQRIVEDIAERIERAG